MRELNKYYTYNFLVLDSELERSLASAYLK